MDGIHDLGGMQGFGAVAHSPAEPSFHEPWEARTRALVLDVLADTGHAEFVIARVRAAIEADPHVAGRLALWARRLVGEALAQAYRVAAERAPLARLLASGEQGGSGGQAAGELGEIGRMFARITDNHAQRMSALGLADWDTAPDGG